MLQRGSAHNCNVSSTHNSPERGHKSANPMVQYEQAVSGTGRASGGRDGSGGVRVNISKDLIIILVIALILFGPSKLAGVGSALGKAIRDFRKTMDGIEGDRSQSSPSDSSLRRP